MLDLPEGCQYLIWKSFNSKYVLDELVTKADFVWRNPSLRLVRLCKDPGCLQLGHSELEDMIEDDRMWAWNNCTKRACDNCRFYGFPCLNLAHYGFNNGNIPFVFVYPL